MSEYNFLQQPYQQDYFVNFLADHFEFNQFLKPLATDTKDAKDLQQLGTITTADEKNIAVFAVKIGNKTKLARNRVGLRNLVLKNIKQNAGDGALAVYIDEQNKQWRLSFIAITPKFDAEGNIKIHKTASKRYTYLLGENTQTRTAEKRLQTISKKFTSADITATFAVEPLNKEFYEKLFNWYTQAQDKVIFPNDENANDHTQISLIRLLTRLLFIWFLKEKGLVNTKLFDEKELKNILHWDKPSSFYKAILQNLFFATLNRPIEDRSPANDNSHFVTNVFRYHSETKGKKPLFKIEYEEISRLFKKTPFLNGGLFECLDRELNKQEQEKDQYSKRIQNTGIRIDGFSTHHQNPLSVPNELFFNQDEQNLGLIDILNQYQFTAEESTPVDIEVALDPELLGRVFENLLASYNPETQQQARKTTGSFYTPREIVNYMVDESLKQYLSQKITPHDNDSEFFNERLNDLFSTADRRTELPSSNDTVLIYKEEIQPIIAALSQVKILDPAVGSGAFPMGALQKITSLLALLDPNNDGWKKQKLLELPSLKSIENDLKVSQQINDTKAKLAAEKELQDKRNAIIEQFKKQDHNYLRKLYLIENCIYGVDIQIIAITIAKLRFFISLTIEQTPNNNPQNNYGITPLPNLETKLIAADSLMCLGEINNGLFEQKIRILHTQLATIRESHFFAKTLRTKIKYREKDRNLRQQMLSELANNGITAKTRNALEKIASWDPYNQNGNADWFDPKWMFGVNHDFDIIIGNPPYATYGLKSEYSTNSISIKQKFDGIQRNSKNLFAYFIEKALIFMSNESTLSFIVPHSLSRVDGYRYIREYINKNSTLWQISDEFNQFSNVTLEMVTIFCSKGSKKIDHINSFSRRENKIYKIPANLYKKINYYPIYYDAIYQKSFKHRLGAINGYRGFSPLPQSEMGRYLYIGGKNIKRYNIEIGHKEYSINYSEQFNQLDNQIIVITQFGASIRAMIINTNKMIPSDGCTIITHENDLLPLFTLSLLNSKLIRYIFDRYIINNAKLTVHLDGHYLKKIPVPKILESKQQPFIAIAKKILTTKEQDKDTIALEQQIDQMVYKLYGLTDDEIVIVENTY